MKPLRIRVRLAIWYSAVLAISLSLFVVIAFEAISHSMIAAVDEDLHAQMLGYQTLLSRGADDSDFVEQFLEHSASGDLVQLAGMSGNWVYRSPAIVPLALAMRPVRTGEVGYETVNVHGSPFQILMLASELGLRIIEFSLPNRWLTTRKQCDGLQYSQVSRSRCFCSSPRREGTG
jgi:hypothetical protein